MEMKLCIDNDCERKFSVLGFSKETGPIEHALRYVKGYLL